MERDRKTDKPRRIPELRKVEWTDTSLATLHHWAAMLRLDPDDDRITRRIATLERLNSDGVDLSEYDIMDVLA